MHGCMDAMDGWAVQWMSIICQTESKALSPIKPLASLVWYIISSPNLPIIFRLLTNYWNIDSVCSKLTILWPLNFTFPLHRCWSPTKQTPRSAPPRRCWHRPLQRWSSPLRRISPWSCFAGETAAMVPLMMGNCEAFVGQSRCDASCDF